MTPITIPPAAQIRFATLAAQTRRLADALAAPADTGGTESDRLIAYRAGLARLQNEAMLAQVFIHKPALRIAP